MKTCEQCGSAYQPRNASQRFCSTACRVRYHRADTRNGDTVADAIAGAKAAVTRLADVAGQAPVDAWTEAWRDLAAHMRAEIARIGAQNAQAEVSTDE